MRKNDLASQIKELKAAQRAAIVDEKNHIADVLLALRRHGNLKEGKWTDPALSMVLESLDELNKIVPRAQSKKLFKAVQNVDFNQSKKSEKAKGKDGPKASSRRTGKGLGATEETDI